MNSTYPHSASSFWERSIFLAPQDVLIVGSGIVGISTALAIKRMAPKAKITVVERGCLPCGASTKNAGFACFGSIGELLMHEKHEGTAAMLEILKMRYDGLKLLLRHVAAKEIDYSPCGGYETFTDEQRDLYLECLANRERINLELKRLLGEGGIFSESDQNIATFGFGKVKHLIFNRAEGRLHSGKLLATLQQKAQQQSIQILTGFEVAELSESHSSVSITSRSGHSIVSSIAVLATNAFSAQLLPELAAEVEPGRGQVLVTKPIKDLKLDGCFHYDQGYFYFRRIEDRVLLGGGRNLDFKGETTTNFSISSRIQAALDRLLREVILPYTDFEVDYRWSGIMCFGPESRPIVRRCRPRIIAAVRMSGMGVAIGSLVAEQAAALAIETL